MTPARWQIPLEPGPAADDIPMLEDAAIDIALPDDVFVRTEFSSYTRKGVSCGAWYVWPPDFGDRSRSPDENWTALMGHYVYPIDRWASP